MARPAGPWARRFEEPIPLPDGGRLVTLHERMRGKLLSQSDLKNASMLADLALHQEVEPSLRIAAII